MSDYGKQDQRIGRVYVGGTFDLFHAGHVNLLRNAWALGPVWVGLNRDEFVERYKGRRPVMSLAERKAVVEACKFVQHVVVNDGDEDSRPVIQQAAPRFIAHGTDWTGREYYKQLGVTEEWLRHRGIIVVYFDYTPSPSSSEIVDRVRADEAVAKVETIRHLADTASPPGIYYSQ